MSFSTYKLTCELCMKEGTKESMFVLLWLTLQWNLISRSEATETISFNQLKWDGDHLKVYFPSHKSDKLGENKDEPRHVYSNPVIPAVCPIRALASYLLLFPDIVSENTKLFPGDRQRSRFNRLFHEILMRNESIYMQNGEDPTLIGTHSIRKGAATYCCAGVHPGPPIVSVCLRAEWTLGRVKERYLKYEVAGDELVGRTLTGIPPTTGEFGVSPVYVIPDANDKFIDQLCSFVFPKPGKNGPLIRAMIATFIYHELFTLRMLHPSSPLHYVSYFQFATTDVNRMKYVETSLPWENKKGCPALTGIPIHCALLNKLLQIHELQKKLPKKIMKKVVEELNTRSIGDPEVLMSNKILEKMELMTQKVVEKLDKIDQMEKNVPQYHESRIFELTTAAADARETNTSEKTIRPVCLFPSQGIWQHYWADMVRRVPANFHFPGSKTLLSLWTS